MPGDVKVRALHLFDNSGTPPRGGFRVSHHSWRQEAAQSSPVMSSRRQQTRQTIEFPERVFKRGNILGFFSHCREGSGDRSYPSPHPIT